MSNSNLVSEINTNVNVGMDEVVNVFVSKYENGLYEKKDSLSKQIKKVNMEIDGLEKEVKGGIVNGDYECEIPILGIKSKVKKKEVERGKKRICVKVEVTDDVKGYGGIDTSKNIYVNLDLDDVMSYKEMIKKRDGLKDELTEVMVDIKGISRKERQIRGKISEMKLKDSGFEGLLNDMDMLKLIEIS